MFVVIPAQAGIHKFQIIIDSRLRGSDTTYLYFTILKLLNFRQVASVGPPGITLNGSADAIPRLIMRMELQWKS